MGGPPGRFEGRRGPSEAIAKGLAQGRLRIPFARAAPCRNLRRSRLPKVTVVRLQLAPHPGRRARDRARLVARDISEKLYIDFYHEIVYGTASCLMLRRPSRASCRGFRRALQRGAHA